MIFVLYTVCISPHQMPLMNLIVSRLGEDHCRYIYTEKLENGRKTLGWHENGESWLIYEKDNPKVCNEILSSCTVLMSGIRDFDLFEYRASKKKTTIYSSERWFKPILFQLPYHLGNISIPGYMKLFHPAYMKMVLRFRYLLTKQKDNGFYYFPISMNAAKDALRICGITCHIDFQRKAGGFCENNKEIEHCTKKMRLWAYFVEASTVHIKALDQLREKQRQEIKHKKRPLHILWVGRMLALKNVNIILKAIKIIKDSGDLDVTLTLVGDGPEKQKLQKLAEGLPVSFQSFVPIEKVREIMREHDLYVFASNSFDGWGAVVSEALEERMPVIASRQSGVGSTILPEECLFHCKNAKELASRILGFDILPNVDGSLWSAKVAADYLIHNFIQ